MEFWSQLYSHGKSDRVGVEFRQVEDLSFVGTCNKHICNNMIELTIIMDNSDLGS